MATWLPGGLAPKSRQSFPVPLDTFQREVLTVLCRRRTPTSPVAGGAVLQQHGFRASEDIDVFNAPNVDVVATAERDMADLKAAGFEVLPTKRFEGFVEAAVAKPEIGATKIQWVQYGGYNFYQPVPDPEFGWRLHFADLAVNKAIAAASRRQPRDLVDLYLVHAFIMPLWHCIWATPGKEAGLTPEKSIERIRYHSQYSRGELDKAIVAADQIAIPDMIADVHSALDVAEDIVKRLPPVTVGKLLVDATGRPLHSIDQLNATGQQAILAVEGGAWPSGADIDHFMIERIIDAYGRNGEKLWAAEPTQPSSTLRRPFN
jgi:hypothetical protein